MCPGTSCLVKKFVCQKVNLFMEENSMIELLRILKWRIWWCLSIVDKTSTGLMSMCWKKVGRGWSAGGWYFYNCVCVIWTSVTWTRQSTKRGFLTGSHRNSTRWRIMACFVNLSVTACSAIATVPWLLQIVQAMNRLCFWCIWTAGVLLNFTSTHNIPFSAAHLPCVVCFFLFQLPSSVVLQRCSHARQPTVSVVCLNSYCSVRTIQYK